MDWMYIFSTAWLLFLIMDPLGNLPMIVCLLKHTDPEKFKKIIFRECLIAFAAMMLALLAGPLLMRLMGLSTSSLGIAGGLILLLISIKMVFGSNTPDSHQLKNEPFIVPIAIPMIAGPALVAMLLIQLADPHASFFGCLIALSLAWISQTVIILCGKPLAALLGPKLIQAMESLMGLMLTSISVEMLVSGIKKSFGIL